MTGALRNSELILIGSCTVKSVTSPTKSKIPKRSRLIARIAKSKKWKPKRRKCRERRTKKLKEQPLKHSIKWTTRIRRVISRFVKSKKTPRTSSMSTSQDSFRRRRAPIKSKNKRIP